MNQSKFSLADVLTVLGAIAFGFLCYLSLNFITLGDTNMSLIGAIVIALILGSLALGAKLLKRTSRNFKTFIVLEWVVLFVFVVVAFIAIFPFSHYFAVSGKREAIQEKIISNITKGENMFAEYEKYADNRIGIYRQRLKSIANSKNVNPGEYTGLGFTSGTDDETQIKNKLFVLQAKLFPSNYMQMKQTDSTWLANSKELITDWSPTGTVKVVNTIDGEISAWRNQLKGFSTFRAQGETYDDFDYSLGFNNVTNEITVQDSPNTLAMISASGIYLIMLLSYFVTKRHTRYPGLKVIFRKGAVKNNEL